MVRLVFLIFLVNGLLLVLCVPGQSRIPMVALEGMVLATLFLYLPQARLKRGLAWAVGLLYGVSAVLVLLDSLVEASLGRPLNLYLDVSIARASAELMLSNFGWTTSLLLVAVVLVACIVLAGVMATILLRIAEHSAHPVRHRLAGAMAALAMLGLMLPAPIVGATATRIGAAHAVQVVEAWAATQHFRERVSMTGGLTGDQAALSALAGTSVVLAFVESYGVSAVFDERYRPVIIPSLESLEKAVNKRGFHMVTGRLRSPVQGGQSWLAHATLLSGLWVDSQQDYDALLASERATLIDDFRSTGHQVVTLVPAVTRPWPEGRVWGYDRILDASNLGYRGPPLNWVTMPDQYVWSYLHEVVLGPSQVPVFAELALISSHAPWVPILPVLEDWQSIGNGEVFEPWRGAGEAPASLWRDPERVRAHYARALAYSLDVVAAYVEKRMSPQTLLVVLGDHQPAPLVIGEGASRDVPVHLISASEELLEPFTGRAGSSGLAGFSPGVRPGPEPGPAMDQLRGFLHQAYRVRGNITHP